MRLAILASALALLASGGLLAPASAQQADDFDFGGLTPGPGREAVYYTCRACHSLKQFTQQRLAREEWGALIDRMVDNNGMAAPEPAVRTLLLAYLATHFGLDEEDWGGLPASPGREEVYYTCQPCHSLRIVVQQGLTRNSWDETLVWMVEEQGMPDPEPEERALILDYLAKHYGP